MKANQIRVHRIFVALLSIWMAAYCWAGTFADAMAAKGRGDFTSAFNKFRQLATSGDTASEFQLSLLFDSGRGTKQDLQEALHWLRLSAAHGNAQAQSNLGVAFSNGRGVVEDPVRAYVWLSVSANAGNPVAATNRDVIARKLTAQQIKQAKVLMVQCQSNGFSTCL